MAAPFPTTRISALQAGRSRDAATRELGFARIAEAYWKPVYVYVRLRHQRDADAAADLTQEFFARAWERGTFASFDPAKARFRTFVRTCVDRFVINEHVASTRLKRGGGFDFVAAEAEVALHGASHDEDPERAFEREWIRTLTQQALEALREADPKRFAIFDAYELSDDGSVTYAQLAERFAMPVTSITNALAAARRELRRLLLERLREITATEDEYRAEARRIFG